MNNDLQSMIDSIPAWGLDTEQSTVSECFGSVMDVLRVMAGRLAVAEDTIRKLQNGTGMRCNECWSVNCICFDGVKC